MPGSHEAIWRSHLRAILADPAYHSKLANPPWYAKYIDRAFYWLSSLFTHLSKAGGMSWIGPAIILAIFIALLLLFNLELQARKPRLHAATALRQSPADWMALADESMRNGLSEQAARYLFQAAIVALENLGQLVVAPHKTNGDYVREVGSRPTPYFLPFRSIARICDEIWYDRHKQWQNEGQSATNPRVKERLQMMRQSVVAILDGEDEMR